MTIFLGTYITFFETKTVDKYSPFCAWKWYIFTFELAISMEVIITCFFWFILYDEMSSRPPYSTSNIQMLGLVAHHSLPLIMLLVDSMINALPFVQRHINMIVPMCLAYLLFNYYVTVTRGKPVYGIMNWKWPVGFVIPAALLGIGIGIFTLFAALSRMKLQVYGNFRSQHKRMHEIIAGQKSFA
jgi:hypothetical protein